MVFHRTETTGPVVLPWMVPPVVVHWYAAVLAGAPPAV